MQAKFLPIRSNRGALALLVLLAGAVATACASVPARENGTAAQNSAYRVQALTSQLSYPAENSKFLPLDPTSESSLISSADAFASVATSVAAPGSDANGPVVESLVSYFNSGFGTRTADGSVTLKYQGTPVWLISAPLNPIVPRTVGGAGFSAPPTTPRSGCSELWVVDAVSATTLTWWQQCPA